MCMHMCMHMHVSLRAGSETQQALRNCEKFASRMIDVAFIVVGGPKLLPKAQQTAEHLNATSSLPVHVHLVTDKRLPQQPWFTQHLLSAMPAEPAALHRNLSKLGVGPSFIYMYKPFLYELLPLDRVLVLDFDVLILGDLRELWDQFDAFSPSSVIGLAHSQSPEYSDLGTWPHKPGPRAGLNGGVQLQHLQRMRADVAAGGAYLRDLRRCAAGGCKRYWKLPRLGDQTYYTGLCLREPATCHVLPCEWNRQLSNRFYTHRDFRPWHECAPPCKLAHGNQPLLEGLIFTLQRRVRRPTCAECNQGYAELKARWSNSSTRNPRWKWGMDKEWMTAVVLRGCCAGTAGWTEAEGVGVTPAQRQGLPLALPPPERGLAPGPEAEEMETPKLADLLAEARAQQGKAVQRDPPPGWLAEARAQRARRDHHAAPTARPAHAGRGVLVRRNHSFGGAVARRNHSWAQGAGRPGWAERHHPRRRSQLNASRGLARAEMRRASGGGGAAVAPCPDCVPATQ